MTANSNQIDLIKVNTRSYADKCSTINDIARKVATSFLSISLLVILSIGCKKNDSPPSLPSVMTNAVANVEDVSANVSGTLTNTGSTTITAAGFCYSFTNPTPTIGDDTIRVNVTLGEFTASLINLQPSKNYNIRAFATNSIGTAYGDAKVFSTGNGAPKALNVTVNGTLKVAEKVTASYTYSDAENEEEGETKFQWYSAIDGTGTDEVAIEGATDSFYMLRNEDEFKYIRVGVKPIAMSGNSVGGEVKSTLLGPIAEAATTVTFEYNGTSVTYGIITSSVTGRKWMDRNLGASNVASSASDWMNAGDMFQWGREADGHQLINGATITDDITAVNGTTDELATSNTAGHNKFIINTTTPNDWLNPQNDNLWNGPTNVNNPCPEGWHIPTRVEWEQENLNQKFSSIYSRLKLTMTGFRNPIGALGFFGAKYWTATSFVDAESGYHYSYSVEFYDSEEAPAVVGFLRGFGLAARCIKDL